MAVDFKSHKSVVIVEGVELHFGFTSVAKAVEFIENNLPKDGKLIANICDALGDGVTIYGTVYQILDIDSYEDVYGASDDETDNE